MIAPAPRRPNILLCVFDSLAACETETETTNNSFVTPAQEAFAEFIQTGQLRADQLTFVNSIIEYLNQNGVIEKKMLFEPPFTHQHDQGLLGVFDDAQASKVIFLIDQVNGNAMASAAI